jgi:CheY-like chemotaxis protein
MTKLPGVLGHHATLQVSAAGGGGEEVTLPGTAFPSEISRRCIRRRLPSSERRAKRRRGIIPAVIRVFVIEDTPQMRHLLEQMLTLDDFQVVGSAANGAAALPEMNQADPDVVVLDYNMPGLDGLLTARLIKEERPGQAIILYTAYLDAELEEKAARSGIALCVEKANGILTLERDIRRLAPGSV